MESKMNCKISPVCSYNEWDPLEEIIVGSVIGAARMAFEPSISAYYPINHPHRKFKGSPFTEEEVYKAEEQLNNLALILKKEGVIVRRPDPINFHKEVKTPDFQIPMGNCSACPRDVLLIIGNEVIEASMAQRARFFEYRAYRSLIKEYFCKGAKWTTAPKPLMADALYVPNYSVEENLFDADTHPALTDFEPCFDAASFVRFGRYIFYQPDVVTNDLGGQWLQRHLGPEYRLHRVKFADKHPPQHIDTTLVPIRPGIVLVNPERPCIDKTLELFYNNQWKVIEAKPSIRGVGFHSPEVSNWISMNFLSIDEKRVIVEEKEEPTIKLLESLGCQVITCAFDEVYKFGGGFHCCTADIRRKSQLQSYFNNID
jgi:glycine amidinotransferase